MATRSAGARSRLPPEIRASAARGWRMFPVKARNKKPPLLKDWPHKASCDLGELERWAAKHEGCNWALACGPESRVFALDIDGENGRASIAEWERLGLKLPVTRTHKTARGYHLLFRWPEGFDFTISGGKLGPGLDARGDRGYIVCPPSIHPSGDLYVCQDETVSLADMPQWLIDLHQAPAISSIQPVPSTTQHPVGPGGRTNRMVSLAGTMLRRGMTVEAVGAALLAENAAQCDPPLSEAKVRSIAADIARRYPVLRNDWSTPREDNWSAEYSDDALALNFTAQHGNDLRYTSATGRWCIWNGKVWEPDVTDYVLHLARKVCREETSKCESGRLASRVASASTVAAVERLARADRRHAATIDQWDADLWLLNTPAGVVDLQTGGVRPARREDYLTKTTAVAPGGNCHLWLSFLSRITDGDQALQQFLQRMCGYALTGVTREHALFFLYGTGANGKSVFLNTVSGVMGNYARTAPVEAFIASTSAHHPTDLAGLRGARLVTAVETEEGRHWAESKLKALTGGDRIAARFMRQDFFEYLPQFKLIIAGNHKPGLRSVDEAMRRRFNLLPFTTTIPICERDNKLTEKLRKEWPGILQWMIDGCLSWQSGGLQPPKVVIEATESYLAGEDALSRWIEDRCEVKSTHSTSATVLFQDWRKWCEQNQEHAGSLKAFSQNLESRPFAKKKTNKGREFIGIGLVTDVTGC